MFSEPRAAVALETQSIRRGEEQRDSNMHVANFD
jgi:hypothetical protein